MRILNEDETEIIIAKLKTFMGKNIEAFLDMKPKKTFLIIRNRVFYAEKGLIDLASSIPRKNLISIGTCLGKFTKTGKFRLQITSLDYLNYFSEHKLYLKPQSEFSFLYGNNIYVKDIARITENAPEKVGVVVISSNEDPIGFGILNKSTEETRNSDSDCVAVFNQADCGLYIRKERDIFGLSAPNENLEVVE